MRSLPDRDSDLDANNRWVIDKLMDLTEEVVCGSWDSELDSPGTEESMRSVQMAVERGDGKAEEEAIVEGIRADLRNWLRKFPERELLTRLFLRAVRRREKSGSPDSRRLPRRSGGSPACEGAAVRRAGQGPAGLRMGGRGGSDGPGTPMASRTLPGHLARVHKALPEEQRVLHRSRDDSI